ncbi:SagB/ThcOx family dehydrogenase [Ramlibacter sp.]|uniref:SagB/ThcOx family dehydrogenase n=1 Tax=Ramlibacter sp. TaxID=1917967 RepID=UPI002D1D65BA|nr:SagB/ThcOx family dehydrogenase [Ramlibacter sp.]HWI81393.1 SagB/ThcOx family dehydrogenase [Ramlibacter sp.]
MLAGTVSGAGALQLLVEAAAQPPAREPPSIALPAVAQEAGASLRSALLRRRSVRDYASQPLPLAAVARLLWAAQGITAGEGRRTAPSAGALYPLELHLVAARVNGLAPGAYRYAAPSHSLHRVTGESVLPVLAQAAFSQQAVASAAAVVVFAAVEERTARKYGARSGRYVSFEAGAASQNLALDAAAQGLGTVVVGAFDDDAVARALRLPPGERPLALMPVGMPR